MSGKVDMNFNMQGSLTANMGDLKLNLPSYSPHTSTDMRIEGGSDLYRLEGYKHAVMDLAGSVSVSLAARVGFGIRLNPGNLLSTPLDAGVSFPETPENVEKLLTF